MNETDLRQLLILNLKRDEGYRKVPYYDTVGKLTGGYGRNLDDIGISEPEAEMMLSNDIHTAVLEVHRTIPNIQQKPWQIRLGIYNMAFNMGITRLLQFTNMLEALDRDDWERVADEALDSRWADQVGERAQRIARLFREAGDVSS